MDLDTFLSSGKSASEFARRLAATPVSISHWRHRKRPIPADRAVQIEIETGGAVMRWDSRPDDWGDIWPELIGTPGAPAWPAKKARAA